MKYITRIVVLGSVLLLGVSAQSASVLAVGEQFKNILITEISPEAQDSPTKEYVVIYNPNEYAVDVGGWRLQYRSAAQAPNTTTGWTNRAIVGCQSVKTTDCTAITEVKIEARETLRLSSFEAGYGISPLASGMATTGGQLRLIQPQTNSTAEATQDMVGYGAAADHEGQGAAPAPMAGRSIVRKQDQLNAFIDTNDNAADFALAIDEESTDQPQSPPVIEPVSGDTQPANYLDVDINEVMPDPASPLSDSADEFIELYNPYDEAVDLAGYTLRSGTNWNYKYVIHDSTVEPHEYLVLMSSQTHISLANAGAGVRLYDPNGRIVSESPSYGQAKTGSSWVRDLAGKWVWTTKATPGEQNVIVPPAEKAASATAAKKSTSSSKTSSTKAKKASTPKVSGSVKGVAATQQLNAAKPEQSNTTAGYLLLGAIGVLAGGYLIYEYRHEVSGFVRHKWQVLRSKIG